MTMHNLLSNSSAFMKHERKWAGPSWWHFFCHFWKRDRQRRLASVVDASYFQNSQNRRHYIQVVSLKTFRPKLNHIESGDVAQGVFASYNFVFELLHAQYKKLWEKNLT